jgi:DNA repair protein RadD
MTLRPYQQEALEAITRDLDLPGASIAVLPTGSGKSHIIAATALLRRPVLILQPSVELLIQNKAKLEAIIGLDEIGVYSASFGTKDIKTFTFATIGSVYKTPDLFKDVKLVIVDECHQLAPRNVSGMLMKFLAGLPGVKVLGTTATPYRIELTYMKEGDVLYAASGVKMINRTRIKDTSSAFWARIIYTISHTQLVKDGYLCPLEYVHEPLVPYETIPVNLSHSDFDLSSYSQSVVGFEANILNTIAEAQKRYKSVLIFCADVSQAEHYTSIVLGSRVITGKTPAKYRQQIVEGFKSGQIQTVFNVGCLTTGFDKPDLDCIILLRPVRSPILYLQMLGRGSRVAPGKDKCTVIDLTGSCKALGVIESFEVFRNNGLWDVRSEKVHGFHGRLLFRMKIQK